MPEGWTLLRPDWLWALAPVVLASLLYARQASAASAWSSAADPHLMEAMRRIGALDPGRTKLSLLPEVAALALVLALTGPAREARDDAVWRNVDGQVILLDLSPSVTSSGHMNEARNAVQLAASQSGGRPSALVVYGGDAYLASVFTRDASVLGRTAALVGVETVPDPGSRPERALAMARDLLHGAHMIGGRVVLISDGGGIGPEALEEARLIADGGAALKILAVPGAGQAQDTEALARLASAGAGGSPASVLNPAAVAAAVAPHGTGRRVSGDLAALSWRDHGRFLVLLALAPVLLMFRRKA